MNLEHFQNRDDAIAAFDRLWDAPAPWILAFTGLSGQGKSTLLDWLEANRCQPHHVPYALIGVGEFAAEIRQAFHALLESPTASLRRHLPPAALSIYQEERRLALAERNRRHLALSPRQEMQSSEGGTQSMTANLAEAYQAMDAQADEVIMDAWLECFAALQGEARVVVLLDNYDSFQDSVAGKELQRFWQFMARAYGRVPGLRVVLACREEIRHQNELRVFHNGSAWDDLHPLNAAHSNALLQSMGVTDLAYRQAIFSRLAHGHPLLTRMAAQAWRKAASGIPASDVPRLNSHEEAVRWVQGRILDRLSGPLKQAVRWAALLRWFNAESLETILTQSLSPDEFQTLTAYAFVIRPRLAPQAWACHDLVRRVQTAYLRQERPAAFHDYHQKAQAYFVAQGEPLEALYHHFFIDQAEAFATWQELESQAAFAFDHTTWSALMEIGLAPELDLGPEQQAEVWYRAGRRHYYRAEWDQAESHLIEALERFNAIGSLLGQANVLKAIGDVQQFRDDRDAALDSYAQALERFNAIGALLGQANVLMAIGDVQQFRKELDAALDSYAQALERFNAIGDRLGQANVLLSNGKLHLEQPDQASRQAGAEMLDRALALYQQIGDRVGQTNIYTFYAQWLTGAGQYQAALGFARQALELALSFIPDHPFTAWLAGFVQELATAAAPDG